MSKNNKDFFRKKNDWSIIKDRLLGCYLSPYFQKVMKTGKPIFYVDCFAGKGKFDDGYDGSPLIALAKREECLSHTTLQNKYGAISTCFIELDHWRELTANIAATRPSYEQPQIISGKYEDNILACLQNKSGYNVFLYIDPYGIKALDSYIFDKVKSYNFNSFEMLINFNSFGFFRDACRAMQVEYQNEPALRDLDDLVEYDPTTVESTMQSIDLLTSIAGGDYWKQIVLDYQAGKIDGYKAEQRLSNEYKQMLKKKYSYVLDMPIRLKANQRPKYRMIHVCDHEDGCFLMAQNMQKRKDELFINIQQSGQLSIFDMGIGGSSSVEGEMYSRDEIENMVKTHVANLPTNVRITKFLATFVNEYGLLCEFKLVYDILNELQNSGVIELLRFPSRTQHNKPTTFWEEGTDKSLTIRRKK